MQKTLDYIWLTLILKVRVYSKMLEEHERVLNNPKLLSNAERLEK